MNSNLENIGKAGSDSETLNKDVNDTIDKERTRDGNDGTAAPSNNLELPDELFGGELYDIFGDDNNVEDDLDFDSASFDLDESENSITATFEDVTGDSPMLLPDGPISALSSEEKKNSEKLTEDEKRRSSFLEGERRNSAPPTWHNDAADRDHRHAMVIEIAQLLQARKKMVPSKSWLKQLPHKARKLEGRLYRTAPTLEAYLDRTTLKNRLKRIARLIVRQYRNKSAISRSGQFRNHQQRSTSLLTRGSLDSIRHAREKMEEQQARRKSEADIPLNVIPIDVNDSKKVSDDGAGSSREDNLSELERQKAINARLQQQILDNIRKQEDLVRRLQSSDNDNEQDKKRRMSEPPERIAKQLVETKKDDAAIQSSRRNSSTSLPPTSGMSNGSTRSSPSSQPALQNMFQGNIGAMSVNPLLARMQQNVNNNMMMGNGALMNNATAAAGFNNPAIALQQQQQQMMASFAQRAGMNVNPMMNMNNANMMAQVFQNSQQQQQQQAMFQQMSNSMTPQQMQMFRASMMAGNPNASAMAAFQAMQTNGANFNLPQVTHNNGNVDNNNKNDNAKETNDKPNVSSGTFNW